MVLKWRSMLDFCTGLEEEAVPSKCSPQCGGGLSWHWAQRRGACDLLPWCGVEDLSEWPAAEDVPMPLGEEDLKPITQEDLDLTMERLAVGIRPWEPRNFSFVRHLQEALGNHGSVEMMQSSLHEGRFVAVKRMPNKWVSVGHREFRRRYPMSPELPWVDLGMLRQLNQRCFPYACDLLGVFGDSESTYVVSSLARCGDLLSWCARPPALGPEREELMRPIAAQICVAARWLHELGVAHRDFSPENVLLTDDGAEMQIRIVDFGMATASRRCCREVRGKEAFQAPEMHGEEPYDAFLSDAFQLGVLLFAMAGRQRPWNSTRPGACRRFGQFAADGELLKSNAGPLTGCSPALLELLEGLLAPDPSRRLTLGESCFAEDHRPSVWTAAWLREVGEALWLRWPWRAGTASEAEAPRRGPPV